MTLMCKDHLYSVVEYILFFFYLYKIGRCGTIANETTLNNRPNDTEVN